MEETEPEKKRPTVAKSSINRKPFVNLTNIVRKPHHISSSSQTKKPGSSTASDSSIGSTQNPNHVIVPADQTLPSTHPRLAPDHLVGHESHITSAQRERTQKARSKTKADVPFYQTSIEETWNNGKIKDQGKGNQSSLDKMTNDGKEMLVVLRSPSVEKVVDKRKAIDVPFSSHHMKKAKNSVDTPIPDSTMKIKGKGKESVGQSSYSSTGNKKLNTGITMPSSLIKINDKGKVAVPSFQTSVKETRSNVKEGSVPICSSTLEKTKDQVKGNQSSLHKMMNAGKEIFVAPYCSSVEKIKNKRKAIDVPFSSHQMKNAKNIMDSPAPHSTSKIKDHRKEDAVAVQSSYPPTVNTNNNMALTMPHSLLKRMDKGKAIAVPLNCPPLNNVKNKKVEVHAPLSGVHIKDRGETIVGSSHIGPAQRDNGKAVAALINYHSLEKANDMPLDYPPMKSVKNNMAEVCGPLSGVNIKDRGETATGSSSITGSGHVAIAQKDEGKAVATPINYRTPEKKDKGRSCPPLLRSTRNRNKADEAIYASQIKLQTEPPNKKRRCSSKEGSKNYALPQDFVEQQRAYFKEIDDFELEVEEV